MRPCVACEWLSGWARPRLQAAARQAAGEQQPDLGTATKEVRKALAALKAEGKAAKAANAASPAVNKGVAPLNVALSLACIGCLRLPSDMDDGHEKHPINSSYSGGWFSL